MSVTNLARYGTNTAPDWAARQRRKDWAADRKAHLQGLKRRREEIDAGKQIVRFEADELQALLAASRAGLGGGSTFWGVVSANAFQERGRTCIRVSADTARAWTAWMRHPDVAAYGPLLAQLDAIADDPPAGARALKMTPDAFRSVVSNLDSQDDTLIRGVRSAAAFLRKARVESTLMAVYASPEQAAYLAEVFVAAQVDRSLVRSLDIIAGRTEPRPY